MQRLHGRIGFLNEGMGLGKRQEARGLFLFTKSPLRAASVTLLPHVYCLIPNIYHSAGAEKLMAVAPVMASAASRVMGTTSMCRVVNWAS